LSSFRYETIKVCMTRQGSGIPAATRVRLPFHADGHTIEREENNKMTEDTQTGKDYFWIYVALATAALVGVVVMAKLSENEKYDPIRAQQNEEVARMNIRVLN
jgi:hypothetical protein